MNVYFVAWNPEACKYADATQYKAIMKAFIRQDEDCCSYAWELPAGFPATTHDIIFLVQTDKKNKAIGVVMLAEFLDNTKRFAQKCQGKALSGLQPIYMFAPKHYDILSAKQLAEAFPSINWDNMPTYVTLDTPDLIQPAINIWCDYVAQHFDTFSTRGELSCRNPKAIVYHNDKTEISITPYADCYISKHYPHVCDICAVDFDYVYPVGTPPQMKYFAGVRKSLSKQVPDTRVVYAVCLNCGQYITSGIDIPVARQRVRPVICDNSSFTMQIRVSPDQLPS